MAAPDEFDEDEPTQETARALLGPNLSASKQPCLVVLAGEQIGQLFTLRDETMIVGREVNADVQILDDGVSRRHAAVHVAAGRVVLEDLGSRNGTSVNGRMARRHVLEDGDKIELGTSTVLKFAFHDELDATFQRQMYDSALRDGLTSAFNKRYFVQRLDNELRFALRHATPLSLILLDIDHFKLVNDTHGHVAGDAVLVELARRVREAIRVEDVFARYGGEEFAVICRAITPDQARVLADRLRASVADRPFVLATTSTHVTISVGVAGLPDARASDPATLERIVDGALYAAKHGGRNRVALATDLPRAGTPSSLPPSMIGRPGAGGLASVRTRKLHAPSSDSLEMAQTRSGKPDPTTR